MKIQLNQQFIVKVKVTPKTPRLQSVNQSPFISCVIVLTAAASVVRKFGAWLSFDLLFLVLALATLPHFHGLLLLLERLVVFFPLFVLLCVTGHLFLMGGV